ncbi:MAG TPA: hypothetical protein VFT74_10960 [Isosphaeraceae bacterium]|nr:hypothetical protein [Isosphaeraceae bacterium]
MSILAVDQTPVNLTCILDPDCDVDDVASADRGWSAYWLNVDRPDFFIIGEPTPIPSDADAPTDPDDLPVDPGFTDCAPIDPDVDTYGILGRLVSGKPVSIEDLNKARTYWGYAPLGAECYCMLRDDECACGTELYQVGLAEFTNRARAALTDYDRWLDALAVEFDPDALDREHMNRACFA